MMLERGTFPDSPGAQSADHKVIDLDRIFAILRRQSRVLALCVALGLGLGVAYLALAPRTYVSSSQILIDKNLQEAVSDVAPTTSAIDLESQVLNQIEVVKSSRIASAVAAAQNLTTDAEFLNPPPSFTGRIKGLLTAPFSGGSDKAPPEATLDEAAGALRSGVIVDRVGRSSVIRVGFEAPNPDLAYRIAKTYADVFVQDQLNADLEATRQSADWLQQRMTEIGESQRQATLAVEQYRRDSGLSTGATTTLSKQRLEALTAQLVIAQAETARVRALSTQLQGVMEAGPDAAGNSVALLTGPGLDDTETATMRTRYASLVRRINEVTNTFGADHPQLPVLEAEKQALLGQIYAQLQGLNEQYLNQLTIAQRQEDGLRSDIEREGQAASESNQSQIELNELQQRSTALGILYNSFLSRYEESIQRQSFPIPAVRVITEASVPRDAASPRTTIVLAGSLIFGLFMGLGFGAINELRERSFRVGGQVGNELGLRFLGYLPKLQFGGKPPSPAQLHRSIKQQVAERSSNAPTTAFLETLKASKLMLRSRGHAGRGMTVGIVSVLPGEGKTTYAVGFAEMLAASGSKVLLIDADLRQPAASGLLTPDASVGLMDISRGTPWREVAYTEPDTGLVILPAISSVNASTSNDFLASPTMQALMEEVRREFEYVVIDLPPLGPVVDAMSILPWTDGFILVAEWGRTPRRLIRALLEREPQLADEIIGVVLNKVDFARLPRYSDPGSAERFVGAYERYYQSAPTLNS